MSYAPVLHAPARSKCGPFNGFGGLLDNNINKPAYYICYVEEWDKNLGLRKYYWSPIKYLSNWDAMGFVSGYSIPADPFKPGYRMSTLYQWNGSSWQKTNLPRM